MSINQQGDNTWKELARVYKLNNIYIQELEVSSKQFKEFGAERLVISFYKEMGYNVEKIRSSHYIASNHKKINQILVWYKDLIEKREQGETGAPDLIAYKNSKNWVFVEVKAYNDTVRPTQLTWYKNHQNFPIRICIVLPKVDSKNIYIAKKGNVPCKHQFVDLYKNRDTGKTCELKDIKKENHGNIVYLHGHMIGFKCKICGLFIPLK